jgi:hypothetical protein
MRARPFLLTLLSVFVVFAACVASASAHSFIIEGKEIAKGETVTAEGTAGPSILRGEEVEGECKKSTSVAELEAEGKSKSTSTTTECRIIGDAPCKITEPIKESTKDELVISNEKLAMKVLPASGEVFTTVTVKGCNQSELNGEWKMEGSQISELPEANVEKVEHEFVDKPSGSSLKAVKSGESHRITVESKGKTKLTSGKKWHSS